MPSSAARRAALVASAALVAVATLVPVSGPPAKPLRLGLWSGSKPGADAVRNVLLFAPLGASLGAHGLSPLRAGGVGLLVSLAVETAQFALPSRSSGTRDVLTNGLGAAWGAALWRRRRRRRPASGARTAGAAAAGVAVLGATAALMAPAPGQLELFGHWTPEFGHLSFYRGQVRFAQIGDVPLVANAAFPDSAAARRALRAAEPIRGVIDVGIPVPGTAPILAVSDARQREIAFVAARGDDVVARLRTRARALGFDQPEIRAGGALRGYLPGERIALEVSWNDGDACVRVDQRHRCGLGPSVGTGYGLFGWFKPAPAWLHAGAAALWLAAIGAFCGLRAPTALVAAAAALLLVASAALLPLAGTLRGTPPHQLAALALGVAVGFRFRYRSGSGGTR
jgi:hypothetical protein